MNRTSNLMNKTLIIGVIILFIGAVVTPSISGYEKKTNIQSVREAPINLPINCDYVNSYWRFNECGGDIAVDSCSPYYNGTIHGATWGGGGGDCALLFDGVDDYVNFSVHAAELGFNKTDDFIISFIFQSTDEGIFISGCAPWGFNPDFQIELLSNGSLFFKLIGSSHLGINLYSSEGYNDGEWHFVEYYHMGISTNPTVLVYVDGNFDNSMSSYYYDMGNDEYTKFKMGVNAHSSIGYFDGIIDDFKIVKYERGNKQNPPAIDGPTGGKPNVEYDYSFITDDPEGDNLSSIYIDWNDGPIEEVIGPFKSGEEVIVSHKWTEEGMYNIKAKSEDFWGEGPWSEPYPVLIGNQPPDPPTIAGPRYGDPGQQLTYTFVVVDPDEENVKLFIDWDDGNTTETSYYASGEEVTETHSWQAGDYYIIAEGIDTEGKIGDWSEPYHIRIGDQPPSTPIINGDTSGKPETEIDFIFSANDPENDQIWYDIKWGDGNEIIDDGPYTSGAPVTKSYAWNKTDTYVIESRARDEFGYYSEWKTHSINIPRNKAFINNLLELLFERFPLLEKLLNLVR